MTEEEFLGKVKELNLPIGKYVVFGSSPLYIHGIRETQDIDILTLPEVYEQLKNQGWEEKTWPDGDHFLTKDNFEVTTTWDYETYHPDVSQLIEEAEIIDGVPFAQLQEVRAWKLAFGREKDLKDIELIDQYLSKQHAAGASSEH